jgi:MarR family 2-MHQ and catechol resistance regulon transcriptional repressor
MNETNLTDEERLALRTFVKLVRAAETITVRVHRHLADANLTPSQFGVLEALLHLGPLCQKDLGAKILKSSGNLTLVLDNLEKRGLVLRERGVKDRRFITVSLTADGDKLIRAIFPRHVRAITEEMRVLTNAEQDELGRLCRIVGRQER